MLKGRKMTRIKQGMQRWVFLICWAKSRTFSKFIYTYTDIYIYIYIYIRSYLKFSSYDTGVSYEENLR